MSPFWVFSRPFSEILEGGGVPEPDLTAPCCQDCQRRQGTTGHDPCHGPGGMVGEKAYDGGGKGADAHLDPAQEGGSRPGSPAKKGQGQRGGIGEDTSLAAQEKETKADGPQQTQPAQKAACEEQNADHRLTH